MLIDESVDLLVEKLALDRKNKVATIGLGQAVNRLNLSDQDLLDIMKLAEMDT